MKKLFVLLLMLCCLLAACNSSENVPNTPDEDDTTVPQQTATEENTEENTEEITEETTEETTEDTTEETIEEITQPVDTPRIVKPLPQTVSLEDIQDVTLFISLEEGDITVDENGQAWMKVTVHTYDVYDMVDISNLQVGDTILLRGREIEVTQLDRGPRTVDVNGGEDNGGFQLWTDEEGVYYELSYSDMKAWQSVGEVTLPIAENFTFVDDSDPEIREALFTLQDLLGEGKEVFYFFIPRNTTIVVENGQITCLFRRYIP